MVQDPLGQDARALLISLVPPPLEPMWCPDQQSWTLEEGEECPGITRQAGDPRKAGQVAALEWQLTGHTLACTVATPCSGVTMYAYSDRMGVRLLLKAPQYVTESSVGRKPPACG